MSAPMKKLSPGERALWAAAFARRLLDKAKPSDHAMSSLEAYAAWKDEVALDAAGCATDVLGYARRARDLLAGSDSPLLFDLVDMVGPPAEKPSGDASLPGIDNVTRKDS